MKLALVHLLGFLVALIVSTNANEASAVLPAFVRQQPLMCYECTSSISNHECLRTGRLARCAVNQGSCQNTVRISNGKLQITKGCKQTSACASNMRQNSAVGSVEKSIAKYGVHAQCSFSWQQTTCRCCCESSRCNRSPLYCASASKVQAQLSDKNPLAGPRKFTPLLLTRGVGPMALKSNNAAPEPTRAPYKADPNAKKNPHDAHPCTFKPCANGGKCIRINLGQFGQEDYRCECKEGWKDSHCNTPVSRRTTIMPRRYMPRIIRRGTMTLTANLQKVRSGFFKLLGGE